MAGKVVLLLLVFGWLAIPVHAVQNVSTGGYNTTVPTGSIANWSKGWIQPSGSSTTTGWNYVGSLTGSGAQASGVYLGNGWVMTCAHVNMGTITLNGTAYPPVAGTYHLLTTVVTGTTYPADLALFRISPYPDLPPLPIRSSAPSPYQSPLAMLGFGDGGNLTNETWGYNTITGIDDTSINGSWESTAFVTETGTSSATINHQTYMVTNNYQAVMGDSGGGDFIYNSASGLWELEGLKEGTFTDSGNNYTIFVELDAYVAQINAIIGTPAVDTPAMPAWVLVLMGGLLFCVAAPAVMLERK